MKKHLSFGFFEMDDSLISDLKKSLSNFSLKFYTRFDSTQKYNHDYYVTRWPLDELIFRDDVTSLYNQRKLFKDLDHLIVTSSGENFSVLFIDVDHFKHINDTYGHIAGSKTLINLANILKETIQNVEYIYRYGGDEFVVIIPHKNLEESFDIATLVLKTIKELAQISVSIGVACYPQDAHSQESIIDFADKMMYHAKKQGRGIVFHTGLLGEE